MIAMVRAIHTTFVSPRGMNCPYTTLGTTLCTRHMIAMVGTQPSYCIYRRRRLIALIRAGRGTCPYIRLFLFGDDLPAQKAADDDVLADLGDGMLLQLGDGDTFVADVGQA